MDSPVLPHLSIHLMICEFKAVYSNILLPPGFKRGISPCYLMIISLLTGGLYLHIIYCIQPQYPLKEDDLLL